MIKIIEKKDKYTKKCPICGTYLEFTDDDLTEKILTEELPDRYMDCKIRTATVYQSITRGFNCPICKQRIDVNYKQFKLPISSHSLSKCEIKGMLR